MEKHLKTLSDCPFTKKRPDIIRPFFIAFRHPAFAFILEIGYKSIFVMVFPYQHI
ncbi:hypothetical protein CHCC20375_0745 [Bacillus licheniformis]|nr:hypothetical protein CHCC20375_0745 [Bacillus licheniformis]